MLMGRLKIALVRESAAHPGMSFQDRSLSGICQKLNLLISFVSGEDESQLAKNCRGYNRAKAAHSSSEVLGGERAVLKAAMVSPRPKVLLRKPVTLDSQRLLDKGGKSRWTRGATPLRSQAAKSGAQLQQNLQLLSGRGGASGKKQ